MADTDGQQSGIKAARWLGYAGLIPFFTLGGGCWLTGGGSFFIAIALGAYAALILSFLGGIRWGIEVARREGPRGSALALSIVSSLVGWAVMCGWLPITMFTLGVLALAFIAQGVWDVLSACLPPWFRQLRLHLTAGAVLSLVSAVLCRAVQSGGLAS